MDIDFGQTLDEHTLKAGLRSLNPDIHFDMGAALGMWHPRMSEWQGIFVRGRHVGAMDRGVIPEFTIYEIDDKGEILKVLRVGWRDTLEGIARRRLPGLDWAAFCRVFKIDYKRFLGDPKAHQLQNAMEAR